MKHKWYLTLLSIFLFHSLFGQGREEIPFNSNWKFTLSDDSRFSALDYNSEDWKTVELPHDWSIASDFGKEYPAGNAGGALPGGIGWYRKDFKLNEIDRMKHVFIRFGGAYRYTDVWINGVHLGKNNNGYLSFERELTKHLHYGDQINTIAVKVDNSLQPNSRWYTGSGIYRNVTLEKRNPSHLLREETFITTPKVSKEESVIRIQSSVNTPAEDGEIVLQDPNGEEVLRKKVTFNSGKLDVRFSIPEIKLWSVEDPQLYQLQINILGNGRNVKDMLTYRVGFRSFHFDTDNGFFLNDQFLKIKGVCLHHDLGLLGAAFNKSAAKRQLLIMKDMGVNAIRTAHNPPAEELLDLCDEIGLLVYNEAYDMWNKRKNKFDYHIDFAEHHLRDLETFVKRDRNHPSIILWSIGNEIREQFDSTGMGYTKGMASLVKQLDPTRPVTAALTENNYSKNFIAQANALDVLGFNYKIFDYDRLPKEFKGIPLIASETTSALQTRGVYDPLQDTIQLWPASSKDKFVVNGNSDFTVSAYDNVAAYWGTTHEKAWLEVKKRNYLGGIFVWTGFDYLGEPVPYPFPARSSYYGIVDLAGIPKDVYYMYQSEWTDAEVLHLLPHWNWEEGQHIDVWAYYNNADEVELFLNEKSLGKSAKTSNRLHAKWEVPFAPGTLKAVKYKDGRVVQEVIKRTAGAPRKLLVATEHERFAVGDTTDLYFIQVSLLDAQGNPVPNEELDLQFKSIKNIRILGTDNGFQADLKSLSLPNRQTHKGVLVAFAKKDNPDEEAIIHIESKLGTEKLILNADKKPN
ncbi:glycoside hydrolase family 2 TIM barrel-domain containing protein [Sphingobacterium lactis]|uniref:Beta-galactosidase n=1 Tax=Sphingobacterium lactis TaxID=797291 RepID=A0A1H6C5M5_9SPHI|nr:glycoside hydrolase family 2 TIM barrel-domain containing protein [Sphingobacterium lactis]SEG68280.1 beta-galactosidase [Sphingobacterium lactis]